MTDDTNRTVRLLAVADRDGFSLGGKFYPIETDGTVVVSRNAVPSLCEKGGFALAPTQPDDEAALADEAAAAFGADPEV
jgi:hypothetical protein